MSAWGNWRNSLSAEENEHWLNSYYYIFGSGDAHNDYTLAGSFLPFESSYFNSVFSDMLPDTAVGGNFGLYSDQPLPISLSNHELTPERTTETTEAIAPSNNNVLIPNTSIAKMAFWDQYFFRYIPEYSSTTQREVSTRQLQNRLVKDVRKLKENLNDLEIEQGGQTSDLPGFIGEIMKAREEEKKLRKLKLQTSREIARRVSAFINVSSEEEEVDNNNKWSSPVRDKAKTLPAKLDESLSKFADELYNNGDVNKKPTTREHLLASSVNSGRSPVLKTKITVQKEDSTPSPLSPASRYVGSSQLAPPLSSPIMPSPPIFKKTTVGIIEGTRDELVDL